jgi:hypothetical protein
MDVNNLIREKIVVSTLKSSAPIDLARDIANKIEKHHEEEIQKLWIRNQIHKELTIHNPDWPKRFISYDKGIKRLYKYKK